MKQDETVVSGVLMFGVVGTGVFGCCGIGCVTEWLRVGGGGCWYAYCIINQQLSCTKQHTIRIHLYRHTLTLYIMNLFSLGTCYLCGADSLIYMELEELTRNS